MTVGKGQPMNYDYGQDVWRAIGMIPIPMMPVQPRPMGSPTDMDKQQYNQSSVSGADLKYQLANGNYYLCPVKIKIIGATDADTEIFVLPAAAASIRAIARLVSTPMIEAGGDVIQETGNENYQIGIRGVVTSDDEEVPIDMMKKVADLKKSGKKLQIINALTDLFLDASDTVVIKEIFFDDMVGTSGSQNYQIQVLSNSPFTLDFDAR
jgi:hypothetical protein